MSILLKICFLLRLFCCLQGIRMMTPPPPPPPPVSISSSLESGIEIENVKNYKKAKIENER
jgi:hypothetical protein